MLAGTHQECLALDTSVNPLIIKGEQPYGGRKFEHGIGI
jgi:hypothetical protein